MPYYFFGQGNGLLLIAVLAVMVIGLIAQAGVKSAYKKYSKVPAKYGAPASMVAKKLLEDNGCSTTVSQINGTLTDHFDPRNNSLGLSSGVYGSYSVAALAIAAHEAGHAMQYNEGYAPIRIRNSILPVAQIGSSFAPIIVIVGLLFSSYNIAMIGVILFAAVLLFQLVTLPVEFNASSRALAMLNRGGYLDFDETQGAKKVLRAAALTYVVAALASALTLLRLLLIANSSRRR